MTKVRNAPPRRTSTSTPSAPATRTTRTGETRPQGRTAVADTGTSNGVRAPQRPAPAGAHVSALLDKVVRNGFAGSTEVGVLVRQIGTIKTKEDLKASFTVLKEQINDGLIISAQHRGTLMNALWDKQQDLGLTGRSAPIPQAVTEAVGEDIFGVGGITRPGMKDLITISTDGAVTARETSKIKGLFAKASNEFELAGLHAGVSKLANNNLMTRGDWVELGRAYAEALSRLTGHGLRNTRALGEDTFGMDRDAMGLRGVDTKWSTAVQDGALGHTEAATLARAIKALNSPEALTAAFVLLRGDLPEVKVELADRRVLAQAFGEAAQKFSPNPLPLNMTRAMNEDMFGIGETRSAAGSAALKAGEDGAVTAQEVKRLKSLIKAVAEPWQWEAAYDHVKVLVRGQAIGSEDRRELATALADKGREFQLSPSVTRGMNEDAFGHTF